LWYRPKVVSPERPLVFHALSVAHTRSLDRRSRLNLTLDSALGELAYSASGTGPLGNSYAGFASATYSVATVTGSAAWQHMLNRRETLTLETRESYRAPVQMAVLPGLSTSTAQAQDTTGTTGTTPPVRRIPKSGTASLTAKLDRRATRRLKLSFPVNVALYASDVVGILGTTAARAGAEYAVSRQTQLAAEAGVTYVAAQDRSTSPLPVFPALQLGVQHQFYASDSREWSAGATARHAGYFDTLQGAYLPVASLSTSARHRNGDVTVSLDMQMSMLTNQNLYTNESRSYVTASLPVTIQLDDQLDLTFGGRASARSAEFPFGPLEPQQVRLLAFVGLGAVTGTEADASWAL
jgi:hypothetical protein